MFSRFGRQSAANRRAAFWLDKLACRTKTTACGTPRQLAGQTVLGYLVVLLTQSFQAKADARTQVLEHLF